MSYIKQFINKKSYWSVIICAGFLLRAIAGWYYQNHQLPDFYAQYGPLATAFASGQGYLDGYRRPPGFILFLGSIAWLFGIDRYIYPAILIQAMVSMLLCFVLYKITYSIFRSEIAGRLAAGLAVFYPWLVYYSTQLSFEHWFVVWLAISVYLLVRFDQKRDYLSAVLLGVALGITAYIRTAITPYIILVIFLFLLRKIPWQKIIIPCTIVSLFIIFWGTFNYCKYGKWSFSGTSHYFQLQLYLGLNPYNKTGGGIWGEDAPSLPEINQMLATAPADKSENLLKDLAVQFVKDNPKEFFILALKKMYIFWRPYPRAPEYTNPLTIAIIFGTFVPLVLFSIYAVWSFRQDKNFVLLAYPVLYIAQLNAIHLVFAGSLVYRFPIEPLLICLASYGLSRLLPE